MRVIYPLIGVAKKQDVLHKYTLNYDIFNNNFSEQLKCKFMGAAKFSSFYKLIDLEDFRELNHHARQ